MKKYIRHIALWGLFLGVLLLGLNTIRPQDQQGQPADSQPVVSKHHSSTPARPGQVVAGPSTYDYASRNRRRYRQRGVASWYGRPFHGRKTASGMRYNMYAMTAAHRTLPFSSYVRVTHLKNHRSVVVKINDRGPFKKGRIIDLSYAAAKRLGLLKTGIARVEVVALPTRGRRVTLNESFAEDERATAKHSAMPSAKKQQWVTTFD